MSGLTEILAAIGRFAIGLISGVGYAGVFLLMAMESMVIPIPAELVMPFAGFLVSTGRFGMFWVFVASSLGSLAGSFLSYYMGRLGGNRFIVRFGKFLLLDLEDLKKTEDWFARKGEKTILIGRLIPVVRHLISIPAGIGSMDRRKFALYTFIGASFWNMCLAVLGYVLGQNWAKIRHYTEPVSVGVVVLLAAGFAYFVYHHVLRKTNRKRLEKELTAGPGGRK
jgi:membrane protein DedA with SNARE-associated domain